MAHVRPHGAQVSAFEPKDELPMNILKALSLSITLGLLGSACAANVGDEANSDSTQDALTVPFAWVSPVAAAVIPAQSSTTLVWTGGDPAWNVNLSIVDVAAWTVAGSVASNVPNSGTYAWTFPASLGCDRDYQFYVENIVPPKKKYKPKTTTMWKYGPVFKLACAPTGPISVPTPAPSGPCASEVVVTNIHYPAQSCAVTTPSFLANMMTMYHFTSKCPTGSQLLGVTSVTCQDAPIPGFSDGSVYAGTVCCGPQLSGFYDVKDSYNAIWTVAQVDVWARNRADSECQTKHGAGSVAQDVIVTNVTWNYVLNETYDDRSFNCVLP